MARIEVRKYGGCERSLKQMKGFNMHGGENGGQVMRWQHVVFVFDVKMGLWCSLLVQGVGCESTQGQNVIFHVETTAFLTCLFPPTLFC